MILFVAFTAPSAICKPRASGDDPGYVRYLPAEVDSLVNPARAGMIRSSSSLSPVRASKPRASGDDPGYVRYLPAEVDVNPARAGMIHRPVPGMRGIKRKPRASGDDPGPSPATKLFTG